MTDPGCRLPLKNEHTVRKLIRVSRSVSAAVSIHKIRWLFDFKRLSQDNPKKHQSWKNYISLSLPRTAWSMVLKSSQTKTEGGEMRKDLKSVTRILTVFKTFLSMAHFTTVTLATNGCERSSYNDIRTQINCM